jgi:hypothetical protein
MDMLTRPRASTSSDRARRAAWREAAGRNHATAFRDRLRTFPGSPSNGVDAMPLSFAIEHGSGRPHFTSLSCCRAQNTWDCDTARYSGGI